MRTVTLLGIGLIALVPSLGRTDDSLVRFKGGIGVDSVSSAPGPAPVAATVNRNIVRTVQPAGQLWTIADLTAEVDIDGHIKVDGRGLVFAGGDAIGTADGTAIRP